MMFLSKLIMNPRSRAVRRDLADCHNMHRTLLAAFPQKDSDAARLEFGLLYRLETNARTGVVTALVQSRIQPDWNKLPADYLLDVSDNPTYKSIDQSYESLITGMRLTFRLRANPTRKIETKSLADGTKRNGKRVELFREEDQIAWLLRKAAISGFRVLTLQLNADVPNVRIKPENKALGFRGNAGEKQKQRLTFGSVLFDGELEITDAKTFKETLEGGIGSGKAYGFGLLSLGPIRR